MSRRGGALFAAGVIGFAAVTTLVGVVSGAPLDFLIADLVTGMAFVVAGYAAIRLRPASPAGPMLLTCAVLWWVGSYSPSGQPVVMYIGFAFERYYDLVLGALLLILSSRSQRLEPRWLIIGFAAAFAFRSFGRLFFFDPATMFGCAECPPNPFAFWPDVAAWEATEVIGSYAIAAFAAAVGVVVVARLLSAGPVLKRARWPILVAGILAMGAATFDAFEYGYTTATRDAAAGPGGHCRLAVQLGSVCGARARPRRDPGGHPADAGRTRTAGWLRRRPGPAGRQQHRRCVASGAGRSVAAAAAAGLGRWVGRGGRHDRRAAGAGAGPDGDAGGGR